jgi:hypothetical protein
VENAPCVEENAAVNFGAAPIIATVRAFGFNCFPPLGGTQANCLLASRGSKVLNTVFALHLVGR